MVPLVHTVAVFVVINIQRISYAEFVAIFRAYFHKKIVFRRASF
jgi:hypothetical protein